MSCELFPPNFISTFALVQNTGPVRPASPVVQGGISSKSLPVNAHFHTSTLLISRMYTKTEVRDSSFSLYTYCEKIKGFQTSPSCVSFIGTPILAIMDKTCKECVSATLSFYSSDVGQDLKGYKSKLQAHNEGLDDGVSVGISVKGKTLMFFFGRVRNDFLTTIQEREKMAQVIDIATSTVYECQA